MDKLQLAVVPGCIAFGPLFMTRIAGSAKPEAGDSLVWLGVFMLSVSLGIMFNRIVRQQKLIEKLQAERHG